jgi:hypothetical protein
VTTSILCQLNHRRWVESNWSVIKCGLPMMRYCKGQNEYIPIVHVTSTYIARFMHLASHCFFLAHLAFRPCELLSSLFVCRPFVNISHFNLLLRNHWTNCNQTLVEWSLDGPLSKLCLVIPTSNQDGRQAKNRKRGGWNFNCPLLL